MTIKAFTSLKPFYLLFLISLLVLVACSKENGPIEQISKVDQKTIPIDYNIDALNKIDQAKVKFSRILANAIKNHQPLKKLLFELVFDKETKRAKEVFILDLLSSDKTASLRSNSESFQDLLLQYGEVEEEDLNNLLDVFCQEFPHVVIDIPPFVEWAYTSDETRDVFVEVYQNYPFAIFPATHGPNENGKWIGYGNVNMNNNSRLYEIASGEAYVDVIPFIIKASELTFVFSEGLILINGNNFIESNIGSHLTPKKIQCVREQLGLYKTVKILCEQEYDVLTYNDFMKITLNCFMGDEICNDGIDNDDDGLIDCEDPDCNCEEICNDGIDNDDDGLVDCQDPDCTCIEICNDGIDNDGDGLIDASDPDCNPDNVEICCDGIDNDGDGKIDEEDSDCCYRDCRTDQNFLLSHRFRDIQVGMATYNSQVPGGERRTQLKYQITTLERSCDTCMPTASTNDQVVTARTFVLYCNTPNNPRDHLTTGETSDLCVSGSSVLQNLQIQGFMGGLVFKGKPEDQGYGYGNGYITFNLRDDIYVRVMNTRRVKSPLAYLRAKKDWDASLIADQLKMSVFEIDEIESTTTSTATTQITTTHNVTGSFGQQFTSKKDSNNTTQTTVNVSYSFTNATQETGSLQFTIKAKDIYELGDLSLFYCDEETFSPILNGASEVWGTDPYVHQLEINQARNTSLDWWDVIEDIE